MSATEIIIKQCQVTALETKKPLVSIIIPVYNGANYLSAAIDCALSQTYENIEVVVVNDGSSDSGKCREIAGRYGDRIKYYEKKNGGVSTALNLGIEKMRGEYFSWLSHDDLYLNTKIEKQIAVILNEARDSVIVYSDSTTFSDSEIKNGGNISAAPPRGKTFKYFIATSGVIHGCSLLIPREAFNRCGLFDENLRYVQDYEMWFRLANQYYFVHIPEVLVFGRIHNTQTGNLNMLSAKVEVDVVRTKFFESLAPLDFGNISDRFTCAIFLPIIRYAISNEYHLLLGAAICKMPCNKMLVTLYVNVITLALSFYQFNRCFVKKLLTHFKKL